MNQSLTWRTGSVTLGCLDCKEMYSPMEGGVRSKKVDCQCGSLDLLHWHPWLSLPHPPPLWWIPRSAPPWKSAEVCQPGCLLLTVPSPCGEIILHSPHTLLLVGLEHCLPQRGWQCLGCPGEDSAFPSLDRSFSFLLQPQQCTHSTSRPRLCFFR